MPVMTPYDVKGIFDILEALEKLEAAEKVPPGTTEAKMRELQDQYGGAMPTAGTSANEGYSGFWTGEDPIEAPWGNDPNFRRRQSMANSMAEDAMLREMLGSRRARTKDDKVEGTFAAAWYPGIDMAIWRAESGLGPVGTRGQMTPEMTEAYKRWGAQQREYLGMPRRIGGKEWDRYRTATKGMGARERRQAFRQFTGGY